MTTKKTFVVHQKVESWICKEVEAENSEDALIKAVSDNDKDWHPSNQYDSIDMDYYIVTEPGEAGGVEFDEYDVQRIFEKQDD